MFLQINLWEFNTGIVVCVLCVLCDERDWCASKEFNRQPNEQVITTEGAYKRRTEPFSSYATHITHMSGIHFIYFYIWYIFCMWN